jgi:GT2 family glycosyltransferase
VDVVVCIHNARDLVHRCLISVVGSTPRTARLIIVDDASNRRLQRELETFAAGRQQVALLRNETRRGYTASANRGLRESRAKLVVLLNSDTIVTTDWLVRLDECAQSDSSIGLVGPLSNSATFQSIPECQVTDGAWVANTLPPGWAPNDVAVALDAVATRAFPRVSMLNGFCLGIKREVIDRIGYFDEEAYGDGYGEEQDYCFRAVDAGFSLAIADHAYVYHSGTGSYRASHRDGLKRKARKMHLRRYEATRLRDAVIQTSQESSLQLLRERMRAVLDRSDAPNSHVASPPMGSTPGLHPCREAAAPDISHSHEELTSQSSEGQRMKSDASLSTTANPVLWGAMSELDTQCASAELAYTLLILALGERDGHGMQGRDQQRKIFLYIQSFLQHAAAVTRLLWPSPNHSAADHGTDIDLLNRVHSERPAVLRELLGAETTLLRESGLHDYPHLYEQKIDAWFIATASRPVADMTIHAGNDSGKRDAQVSIRHFDPISMTYTVFGQNFDLPAIAAVLGWIHLSAARWAASQFAE